jgi:regulator of protease activity HflC (stomatin/prohibitin superfamily)
LGRVSERTLNPGVHLVNPFTEVEIFSTRLKDVKETIEATSQEGLAFNIDVSLQYKLDPQKAAEVYKILVLKREILLLPDFAPLSAKLLLVTRL